MKYKPLSNMTGFSPAVARVKAANSPDGPDPTITTLEAGFSVSSICPCVWALAVTVVDSGEEMKKKNEDKLLKNFSSSFKLKRWEIIFL